MKHLCLLFLCFSLTSHALDRQWELLLDEDLTKWELWMGVPHSAITGLPDNTHTSDSIFTDVVGRGMGLNNDPKKVFSVNKVKDETILTITGEIFGGLTTLQEYQNYHLSLKVKWGDKKWPPRLNLPLDTGVLFHCQGEHAVVWSVWKSCLEFQIMEGYFGAFIPLMGTSGKVKSEIASYGNQKYFKYSPSSQIYNKKVSEVLPSLNIEKPHGQWNHLELYVLGDKAVFVVNNTVVMTVEEMTDKYGQVLSKGQLQIQSEGAEVFYKEIKIRSIQAFPQQLKNDQYMN